MGTAASRPTSPSADDPSGLPTQTPIAYSGFHATVQASRSPAEVPVFHAIGGRRTSAAWPVVSIARSSPESMSLTSQQASGEKIGFAGGAFPVSTNRAGIHAPPCARQA